MTQPTEPQGNTPNPLTDATVQTTAQWLDIYESDSAKVSVLLRGNSVTRLLVNTEETLPIGFAVNALLYPVTSALRLTWKSHRTSRQNSTEQRPVSHSLKAK